MIKKNLYVAVPNLGALFVAAVLVACPVAEALAVEAHPVRVAAPLSGTTEIVDPELISILEDEARRKVSEYLQSRGRLASVRVTVSIDLVTSRLTADFGPGFRPGIEQEYAEAFLHSLATTFRHYAELAGVKVHDVDFLFEGKPLKHYFPGDLAVPVRARVDPGNATALVSSSHGLVRVFPSQDWDFQRPLAFGFREDSITPAYGDELQALLEQRSGLVVFRARSRSPEPHPESSRPWEQMSSRYQLKAVLPDRADIWNSLPTDTARDREVREDIRARPLYANDIGAGGMISLHTNGHDIATVRGVEVFYHGDKPADGPLADSVLCGMREVIRAQPGYDDFPVRDAANEGRHGENRIGTMPSVLVEVAYHSNAEDSAALQDPVFRAASMKGVEKKYRLFREGKACTPFALNQIPDVAIATGTSQEIVLVLGGHPQFPVTMEFTTANCSAPGACKPSKTTFADPGAPITALMRCRGSLTGDARWSVVLRDADGVTTRPVEFQHSCFKPGAQPTA